MGTQGNYLYRPSYGASGTDEYNKFDAGLEAADNELTLCNEHRNATANVHGLNFTGEGSGGGLDADMVDGQHRVLTINADHSHQSTGAQGGQLDHGAALTGLSDDDHSQYALLAGRSGGQTIQGGTGAGDELKLISTSNATKGEIDITDRILRLGTTEYPTSAYQYGDCAYFVIDKSATAADASIVFRDQGSARAEVGIIGDNDFHIKRVTGTYPNETFTDKLIIGDAAVDIYNALLRCFGTTGTVMIVAGNSNGSTGVGLQLAYEYSNSLSRITSVEWGNVYRDLIFEGQNIRFNVGSTTVAEAVRITSNKGIAVGSGYAGTYSPPNDGMIVQGYIGIGTSNPTVDLQVGDGSGEKNVMLYSGSATVQLISRAYGASPFEIHIDPAGAALDRIIMQFDASENLILDPSGVTNYQLFLKSDGNVGIGTSTPSAKLDVSGGNIRTTGQLISTVATGTAPLSVSSTTAVTNLNADMIDGQHRTLTINADHNHQSTGAQGGQLDHGLALTGLTDDDHTQYALLAGRSGGQTIQGGTGASENLTLRSTSNATKGSIIIGDDGSKPRIYGTSGTVPLYIGSTDGSTGEGLEVKYEFTNDLTRLTSIERGVSYRDVVVEGSNIRFATGTSTVTENVKINAWGQIVSNLVTGTAPLVISSTTGIPNLNADMVDGYHASQLALSVNNVRLFDDFLNVKVDTTTSTLWSDHVWYADGVSVDTSHRGVIIAGGTSNLGILSPNAIYIVASNPTFEARIAQNGTLTTVYCMVGLMSTISNAPNNAVFFRWLSGGTLYGVCRSSNNETTFNTGVTMSDGVWHILKFIASSSSVQFYVDGNYKGQITTNIPAASIYLGAGTATADVTIKIDYFYYMFTR